MRCAGSGRATSFSMRSDQRSAGAIGSLTTAFAGTVSMFFPLSKKLAPHELILDSLLLPPPGFEEPLISTIDDLFSST